MKREDVDFVKRNPLVARLLTQELPKMQPSALKHEFATSVANVMRHPVATETAQNGDVYVIGFGDHRRRLPLLLIQEPTDGTIRHAHVPYPNDKMQSKMLDLLQADENRWTREHSSADRKLQTRDIRFLIQDDSVDYVNQHGIQGHQPFPMSRVEQEDLMRGDWYPTQPMPRSLEFDHKPEPRQHADANKLGRNLGQSITMATSRGKPKTLSAVLEATKPGKPLKVDRFIFEDPEEPISELEY